MKRISWKFVLALLIGIPIVNIFAEQIGRGAAAWFNEREARAKKTSSPAPAIQTLVSSQDAEGVTQQQMDLDFLRNLEVYTVQRATAKTNEKLAAAGHPDMKVRFTSEATYVESGPIKLALIRLSATGARSIFIAGIVGRELKRVLCWRESEESIPVASGPCADKIREVFGVSFGG